VARVEFLLCVCVNIIVSLG